MPNRRCRWRMVIASFKGSADLLLCAATVIASHAQITATSPVSNDITFIGTAVDAPTTVQSFITLANFNGNNGAAPQHMALVQGTNGCLYGSTPYGGAFGFGTIFKIAPSGALKTVYSFTGGSDGSGGTGLVLATNGSFYGGAGGGDGTIFKMSSAGTLTTLHSFDFFDGDGPNVLVEGADKNLYGTTVVGGDHGNGTVFKITLGGMLTTLHSFDFTDGTLIYGGLIQAANGKLYGTTFGGGTNGLPTGYGTVFSITTGGTLSTLHDFNGTDGNNPFAGLVQATDGNLYGTTYLGGPIGSGTIFRITPAGRLTTVYSFGGNIDTGTAPECALVQATDGNLYGTTMEGGTNFSCGGGCGTIFKITLSGTLTTLHDFDYTEGQYPVGALVQGTDGAFYGTTSGGGTNGNGTVFRLSVGLAPFVKTLPTSGKVEAAIKILGTNLTGATSVTFNGIAAAFTVVSPSLIQTTVPTGATSGKVQVMTPGGTLSSNVAFRVHL